MAVQLPGHSFLIQLRERGLLLPIGLSLVVVAILAHGFLHREAGTDPESPTSPESPAPTSTPFRPDLEKVPLTYFSDYWLQLGERSNDLLVSLGEARATGVRVSAGYALASVETADAVRVAPGEAPEGELVAVDGREGVALFRLAGEVGSAPLPTAQPLHAGAWLAAVTMDAERGLQVIPGHLASTPANGAEPLDVALPFPSTLDVAALVDLDARLVGVAVGAPGGARVFSAGAASGIVERLASNPACRAVDVDVLPDAVRRTLRLKEGVMVTGVAIAAFSVAPDLKPGDVLLQLAGETLSDPDGFAVAWDSQKPGSRVRFLISRGSRRLVGRAEMPGPDCRPDGATPREMPLLGAPVQWTPAPDRGFRLLWVPPDSPASVAGLERGDVLVAVDGAELAWPEARRILEPGWGQRHSPVFSVKRSGAVRLTVIPEAGGE